MKLTEDQVANWRRMLCIFYGIGPYALIMPVEQVERLAQRFQDKLDSLATDEEAEGTP